MATQRARPATSLLDLGGRLVGELARLLDQRLDLLKAELKQGAAEALQHLGLVIGGMLGVSVGIAFTLLALGLWIGDLVGSTPGGLAIVGGSLTLIGAVLGLFGIRSLHGQRLVPETAREFRRDEEWIRHEV
jgi:uncharacterized membrane protein YqjE